MNDEQSDAGVEEIRGMLKKMFKNSRTNVKNLKHLATIFDHTIKRNGNAIVENKKGDSARTNEVFDHNNELTENPLYLTSQPEEEVGNTSGEKLELGLPVMDSKTKRKNNPDYDVPQNNKPIDSIPVYAVPNKNKTLHHMVNNGDVYAQVKK
uniref:Uncharacterized protein n=1 Tax=Magallana gigas TaxID=29159 RepID=K1PK83_MAGGI